MERYNDWAAQQKITCSGYFPSANVLPAVFEEQQEDKAKTIAAIANLATGTAANRATIASLTETSNNLTIKLRNTQAKLVAALEKKTQPSQTEKRTPTHAAPTTTEPPTHTPRTATTAGITGTYATTTETAALPLQPDTTRTRAPAHPLVTRPRTRMSGSKSSPELTTDRLREISTKSTI